MCAIEVILAPNLKLSDVKRIQQEIAKIERVMFTKARMKELTEKESAAIKKASLRYATQ